MYSKSPAYILLLFAGVLFPDTSENLVHMNFLSLLEDFDRCSRLSLYRNLCKASLNGATIIVGPLMLLQLWAWCRIRATSPNFANDGQRSGIPYGVRYIIYF